MIDATQPGQPASAAERKRQQRRRLSETGGRQIAVHLSAPVAAALATLQAASGGDATSVVSDALLQAAARLGDRT